jgi:hypothetical protein
MVAKFALIFRSTNPPLRLLQTQPGGFYSRFRRDSLLVAKTKATRVARRPGRNVAWSTLKHYGENVTCASPLTQIGY